MQAPTINCTPYAKIFSMNAENFVFINSVAGEDIADFGDILKNERLKKYLWIELILNPHLAAVAALHMDKEAVRESLSDAVSWYAAFRWLFQKNEALEKLLGEKLIVTYRIKNKDYRLKKRNFLKGILHARLC